MAGVDRKVRRANYGAIERGSLTCRTVIKIDNCLKFIVVVSALAMGVQHNMSRHMILNDETITYLFSSINLCFVIHQEVLVLNVKFLFPVLIVIPKNDEDWIINTLSRGLITRLLNVQRTDYGNRFHFFKDVLVSVESILLRCFLLVIKLKRKSSCRRFS